MSVTGPHLVALLHRLAECPADFLLGPLTADPKKGDKIDGEINVTALACDHFRALGAAIPESKERTALAALPRETLCVLPVVLWLLRDGWFLARPQLAQATLKLLLSEALTGLAKLVRAEAFVNDPDRREELVRLCLKELDVLPEGETAVQAADRLSTLDSVERDRVIRKTRQAEARAREIREAMVRKRAQEAAARYSRE